MPKCSLKGGEVQIAGMTKGSGMIHPNMATTLGFVMTDAAISPIHLRQMLVRAVERSYNRLRVDGDTSTNDIVVLLANGASGIRPSERERRSMEESLCLVMEDLAEQIARDGEGATKLITIRVSARRTRKRPTKIARSIANSPLVKTAIAGSDPNWGRILSAAGTRRRRVRSRTRSTSSCRACRFARAGWRPSSPRWSCKTRLDDRDVPDPF